MLFNARGQVPRLTGTLRRFLYKGSPGDELDIEVETSKRLQALQKQSRSVLLPLALPHQFNSTTKREAETASGVATSSAAGEFSWNWFQNAVKGCL